MMNSALSRDTGGWLMVAGGIVTYGLLVLAGAALTKYLFFGNRSSAAT